MADDEAGDVSLLSLDHHGHSSDRPNGSGSSLQQHDNNHMGNAPPPSNVHVPSRSPAKQRHQQASRAAAAGSPSSNTVRAKIMWFIRFMLTRHALILAALCICLPIFHWWVFLQTKGGLHQRPSKLFPRHLGHATTNASRRMNGSAWDQTSYERLFWFMHISDIHLQTNKPQVARAFARFVNSSLSQVIRPAFTVATGDLVHGKHPKLYLRGQEHLLNEWDAYRTILQQASLFDETKWVDMQGNHDAGHMDGQYSTFRAYAVQGNRLAGKDNTFVYEAPFGRYRILLPHVLARRGGLQLSLVFWGLLDDTTLNWMHARGREWIDYSGTFVAAHWPMNSVTRTDRGFGSLYGQRFDDRTLARETGVLAFLCGHSHKAGMHSRFSNKANAMFRYESTADGGGGLELEVEDFKDKRAYRVIAMDADMFSIADHHFDENNGSSEWPLGVITSPKDARYLSSYEPLDVPVTHVRVLAFSNVPIVSVTGTLTIAGGTAFPLTFTQAPVPSASSLARDEAAGNATVDVSLLRGLTQGPLWTAAIPGAALPLGGGEHALTVTVTDALSRQYIRSQPVTTNSMAPPLGINPAQVHQREDLISAWVWVLSFVYMSLAFALVVPKLWRMIKFSCECGRARMVGPHTAGRFKLTAADARSAQLAARLEVAVPARIAYCVQCPSFTHDFDEVDESKYKYAPAMLEGGDGDVGNSGGVGEGTVAGAQIGVAAEMGETNATTIGGSATETVVAAAYLADQSPNPEATPSAAGPEPATVAFPPLPVKDARREGCCQVISWQLGMLIDQYAMLPGFEWTFFALMYSLMMFGPWVAGKGISNDDDYSHLMESGVYLGSKYHSVLPQIPFLVFPMIVVLYPALILCANAMPFSAIYFAATSSGRDPLRLHVAVNEQLAGASAAQQIARKLSSYMALFPFPSASAVGDAAYFDQIVAVALKEGQEGEDATTVYARQSVVRSLSDGSKLKAPWGIALALLSSAAWCFAVYQVWSAFGFGAIFLSPVVFWGGSVMILMMVRAFELNNQWRLALIRALKNSE